MIYLTKQTINKLQLHLQDEKRLEALPTRKRKRLVRAARKEIGLKIEN